MKVGQHVFADFGDGPVLAHVVSGASDGVEVKYGIQAPSGSVHALAYREPHDRDAGGSGGTFWASGVESP